MIYCKFFKKETKYVTPDEEKLCKKNGKLCDECEELEISIEEDEEVTDYSRMSIIDDEE